MPHVSARRLGALSTTLLLTTGTLLSGAPAQAASSPSADSAQAWLAGELVEGLVPNGFGGYDVGLSIDAALLAAATGDTATATRIRDAVEAQLVDYTSDDNYGDPGSTYASNVAKVLVLVVRTGGDPRSYGGTDLVARVESTTAPDGRIESVGQYATKANTIGQAFAVDGLAATGSAEAEAARGWLAGLQCPDGSFSLTMPASGAAPRCGADDASTDATAFALDALADAPGTPQAVLDRTADWLTATQGADGSWGSDATIQTPNSNSTGLAAAALGSACRVAAAERAAAWVRSVQLTSGTDAGAVAYDAAAAAEARSAGIDEVLRDQFRRATAQAATGVVWDPQAPTGLALEARGGRLVITGARSGEAVCLTTPDGTQRLTGTGTPLEVPLPATASGTTYAATTGPGRATLVLGSSTTAPAAPAAPTVAPVSLPAPTAARVQVRFGGKRLVRGERHVVRVSGLGTGQRVVVSLRGRTVAGDVAGPSGRVVLRFRVSTRPGRARLAVEAPGGTVRTTVRVVR